MRHSAQLHVSHQLNYRLGILRDGKIVYETKSRPHMLTDAGLEKIGSYHALDQLEKCILGKAVSPTPIRRDDASVTFTQAGNVITASSAFFLAADVGRLFKWGVGSAGSEVYIIAYVSATSVEVSSSVTVAAPTNGTIWYVNTAALNDAVAGLTWTKQPTGNGSVAAVVGDTCIVTHTTVNVSSALTAPATITELAISDTTANAGVFDRDVISPPVALLTGDQAVVTIEYVARYSPVTPVAVGNVATGYDSSGNMQVESIGMANSGIKTFTAAGGVNGLGSLEPSRAGYMSVKVGANFTIQPFASGMGPSSGFTYKAATNLAYGSGTRFRDSTVTFPISEANGVIYGFSHSEDSYGRNGVTIKFTTPFTKLNTQTLSFTFRKSWSRVLTN